MFKQVVRPIEIDADHDSVVLFDWCQCGRQNSEQGYTVIEHRLHVIASKQAAGTFWRQANDLRIEALEAKSPRTAKTITE